MPRATSIVRRSAKPKRSSRVEPPEPKKRILVIGGTHFIGRHLVNELLRAGHEVYVLHRRRRHSFGKRVRNLVADRNDAATVRKAVGAIRFDAVYDNVYDWERGTTGAQVEATAQIFDGKVGRYVFMSSVAAYGDGLNHHEGDALAPDDHPNPYARNKAVSERALFRMHQRSGFPIVTLRPPFVYGPGNPFYREAFFWDRFRAERPIILPSEGHRLMQFIYVNDLVELAIKVVELRNAVGHAFNTANPRPLTQHELILELARAAQAKEPEIVSIPRELIRRAGGQAIGENLYFGYYYDVPAITQIITKAQRMLAFKPTDFAVGLRATYRAYLKKRGFPRPDFTFEDELLSRFSVQMHSPRSA
ncbi:MAG: NAD-dependent epimerase/dehydratase family protein [Acidobacteriaceae bacterium]|nr:NAD-dependent epimerase/dehydratase family protein [Acidobacteriaceae bacterium]MBV9296461.1 NAD-dependent epimerase/dehydratase family protein [Acidobacteriaceae bacterium]MBV9763764.1 NAD-dependent epimerase/dehydratase family protein [Acidobacteriaceae bacterium]